MFIVMFFHINEHVVKHEVTLLLKPVLLNVTKKRGLLFDPLQPGNSR